MSGFSRAIESFASKSSLRTFLGGSLLVLAVLLCLPSVGSGQTNSTITWTVQDKQGLTVPGSMFRGDETVCSVCNKY